MLSICEYSFFSVNEQTKNPQKRARIPLYPVKFNFTKMEDWEKWRRQPFFVCYVWVNWFMACSKIVEPPKPKRLITSTYSDTRKMYNLIFLVRHFDYQLKLLYCFWNNIISKYLHWWRTTIFVIIKCTSL